MSEINDWIDQTTSSDETLKSLELELNDQQSKLKENDDSANDLIDKISTLDSLRNTLPKQTFRQRRDLDDSDETDG